MDGSDARGRVDEGGRTSNLLAKTSLVFGRHIESIIGMVHIVRRLHEALWLLLDLLDAVEIVVVHVHAHLIVKRFPFEFVGQITVGVLIHVLSLSIHVIRIISLINGTVAESHGRVDGVNAVVVVEIVFFGVVGSGELARLLQLVVRHRPLALRVVLGRVARLRLRAHLRHVILVHRCLLNCSKIIILLAHACHPIARDAAFGLLSGRLPLARGDRVEVHVVEIVIGMVLRWHARWIVLPVGHAAIASRMATKTSKIHY